MKMATMEDEELRRKLKELGEDVVVTDSTRGFLTNRLRRLSQQPSRRIENSGRRSLLNFSSDESESDSSRASAGRSGNSPAILGTANITERRSKRTSRSSSTVNSAGWNDDNFVQPRNPLRRSVTSIVDNRSSLPSRSTTSSGGAMTPTRHHQQQRSSHAFNLTSVSTPQIRPSPIRRSKRGSSKEKTIDASGSDSDVSDSSITNIPENTGVDEFPTSRRSIITTVTPPPSSREASRKLSPLINSRRDENSEFSGDEGVPLINGHHGLLEEEPISSVDLNNSSFASTASESSLKNNSQCISMILVIILAFFFLVVGLIYLRYSDQVPYDALGTKTDNLCVDDTICNSQSQQVPSTTEIALHLKSILQIMRGDAECDQTKSARLSIEEARVKIHGFAKGVSVALNDVLTIFDRNKHWGIKFLDFSGDVTDASNPSLIWWLESQVPIMSWSCRFLKAWQSTVHKVTVALIGILAVAAVAAVVYFMKEREKKRKQEIYNMVEKILETLQYNYTAENNLEPYTPIPHVRDRLIPPAERESKRRIWDEAVKYIQEYESRVRQEVRMVKGEDIAVWHWLPADNSPVVGRSRSGRLWQGQAFENTDSGVNALPYSPSPCLKVRNMFDPEIEIEDNWTDHIKDEILEKCAGSDIVHIRVDESLQGCVYIKCKDAVTAGQVFKRLHGSWFDGKLVTVKYLRLERYHERFPDAINCTKPLKASTQIGLINHNSACSS